jgi:hypothetical protein
VGVGDRKLLGIYLNDHLAGATAGAELAKRARGSNAGTELGEYLAGLAVEIAEDRETLKRIMRDLGVGQDKPKVLAGWAAEKAGRLKPNGRLLGYSPLSRVVELEGLALGVTGKLALWRALRDLAGHEPALDAGELDRLARRAEAQRDGLELHRRSAAEAAFGGG